MMIVRAPFSITRAVITLGILVIAANGIITGKDASALKAGLIKDYDKNVNPSIDYMNKINVSVEFLIDAIGSIDEQQEKMTTIMTLEIEWEDEHIVWNYTDTGIRYLPFDKSEVWVPEYLVHNTHYDISYVKQNIQTPILIRHDGDAEYSQRLVAETSCSLDMTNFPFDHHTCSIEFILDKEFANVIASFENPDLEEFSPDGTWDVTDTALAKDSRRNRVVLDITVARKPTFLIVNLISPMTMLALLSPIVFMLPYNSGERIGFSVTILLSLSVFMTMVADSVPQKSQPLPRLIYMIFISYSLSALVVIIVVINARICDFSDHIPVPCCLVALVTCTRCFCYCLRRRDGPINDELKQNKVADTCVEDTETECIKEAKTASVVKWKDVSWAIDMLAMIIIYLLKLTLLAVTFGTIKS